MPCTEAKRLANQRNAQKSTGPKTDAGKLAARLNSLTHGMRSELGLTPKHLAEAVAKHHKMLTDHYHPATDHQSWLLEQVADAAAKLDYCQFMLRAEIDNMADRADLCWDEDLCLAAEETASRLSKDPSRTVARLRETPQGCRWILARWDALGVPLAENTPWNEDQCNLAANLMGVDSDLRPSYPTLNPSATAEDHAAILNENADSIHSLMVDSLKPLDAKARELTQMGFPLRPSKAYLRFERYETRLRKAYFQALDAFRQARSEGVSASEPITCLPPESEPVSLPLAPETYQPPEPEPEPKSEPAFEAESSFAGNPLIAMVTALAESVNASRAARSSTASPASASSQPKTSPMNRKARRALEKAARKRNRQAKAR